MTRHTFFVSKNNNDMLKVCIVTSSYHSYDEWMPFIVWNGTFLESFPMKASFYCPRDEIASMKEILKEHDYVEVN